MPKRKLKDLNLIDGKQEIEDSSGEKFIPSTLEQIFGDKGDWKYSTTDLEEYKIFLSEMNFSDVRTHASKVGIMPHTNRERLTKRLLTEFVKHYNSYKKPANPNVANSTKKPSKAVLDILAEAK